MVAKTGIIDQQIDLEALASHSLEYLFRYGGVGQILDQGDYSGGTEGGEFGRDLSQTGFAAGDQHQLIAVASKPFGQFITDAEGGACDEDGFLLEHFFPVNRVIEIGPLPAG